MYHIEPISQTYLSLTANKKFIELLWIVPFLKASKQSTAYLITIALFLNIFKSPIIVLVILGIAYFLCSFYCPVFCIYCNIVCPEILRIMVRSNIFTLINIYLAATLKERGWIGTQQNTIPYILCDKHSLNLHSSTKPWARYYLYILS